jgi:hypothetical protein
MHYPDRFYPGRPASLIGFFRICMLLCSLTLLSHQTAGATTEEEQLRQVIEQFSTKEQMSMLQAVCDIGTLDTSDGDAYCNACPRYTSAGHISRDFTPDGIITGSFTRPHVNEALLNMEGCEDQNRLYGGTVLLQKDASGWRRVWYKAGYRLEGCMKFITVRGVAGLLCRQSHISQNILRGELLWVDIQGVGLTTTSLAPFIDNIDSDPRDLVTIFPSQIVRTDFNLDGKSDAFVSFRITTHRIPEEYSGALEAMERKYHLPKPEIMKIIFLFNGTRLVPSPGSESDLEEIRSIIRKHIRASTGQPAS